MKKILTLSIVLNIFSLTISGQTAHEIIKKSDELVRGESSFADITMKVIKPEWTREFSMKTWSKGKDYSLVYITAPAKDKGAVTLMRKKEVWNYLPSVDKTIKIPSSMMTQSWMGSDFTNDDMVKQSSILEDYTQDIIGDSTIENKVCWKIKLTPKEDAAVVWGKIIMFISKEGFFQIESQFYDEDGVKIKVMKSSAIKNVGNRILPSMMEMIPLDKPGNKTVFIYHSAKFNEPVDDSFFSQQNMKKVK